MTQTASTTVEVDAGRGDPATVVRAFLAALEDLDIDRAMTFVDPEMTYHNKGLPAARGEAAVERQLRALARHGSVFEARIHNLAADGPIVLTERTDVIGIGRFRAEFWVCGTFEVRDGRVVLWRDYFDFVNMTLGTLKGLARGLLGRGRATG